MNSAAKLLSCAVLLLASPAARANQAAYDATVMAQPGVTYYWPFSANVTPLVGSGSSSLATCVGTCTFGVTLGTNVTGYIPGNGTSGINFNNGAFASNAIGWSTALVYNSTNTAAVAFMLGSSAASPTVENIYVNPSSQCASPNAEFVLVNPGVTIGCGTTTVSDGNTHVIGSACTVTGGTSVSCRIVVDGVTQATIALSGATFAGGLADYTFGGDPFSSGQVVIDGGEGELVQAQGTVWPDSVFLTLYKCATGVPGACVGSSIGTGKLIDDE